MENSLNASREPLLPGNPISSFIEKPAIHFNDISQDFNRSMFVNHRLPPIIYQRASGISGFITLPTTKGRPRVRCTSLIMVLFFWILILNASYSICAPFLPMEADKHNISQSWLGIMFCVYSISMAAFSPVVGKYQYQLGRRNLSKWGMIVVAFPFVGFWLNDYSTSAVTFILVFILMRIVQGIGTSMVQTSAYAILTLTYPRDINFVVSCLEMAAGLGLSLGPVIGTILYKLGGIELTFISFFVIWIVIGLVIKSQLPYEVDTVLDEEEEKAPDISYSQLLLNKRILFANMCVFLAVFQYAFIDPLLANYMHYQFGIGFETSGYFFLAIGFGYTMSCYLAHITCDHFSNMRISIVACILLGIATMSYGSSNILQIPTNLVIICFALFSAGIVNSHLIIPPMEEMLDVGEALVRLYFLIYSSSLTKIKMHSMICDQASSIRSSHLGKFLGRWLATSYIPRPDLPPLETTSE